MDSVPETPGQQTRTAVTRRIIAHVRRGWPRLGEPIVRHRGRFCYVSALMPGHREPTPILRLRYQGSADRWAIGIYRASSGQYTESELPASFGPKTGTPEEGVDDTFILYAGPKTGHLRPSARTRAQATKVRNTSVPAMASNILRPSVNRLRSGPLMAALPSICLHSHYVASLKATEARQGYGQDRPIARILAVPPVRPALGSDAGTVTQPTTFARTFLPGSMPLHTARGPTKRRS